MMKKLLHAILLAGTAAGWAANNPVLRQENDYFCRAVSSFEEKGSLEEWRRCGALPLFLAEERNRMIPDWEGPLDVEVTVYLLHDARFLYFGALVRDRHPSRQASPEALYRGDGFQLAFDPLDDTILPGYDANDIELGFGLLQNGTPRPIAGAVAKHSRPAFCRKSGLRSHRSDRIACFTRRPFPGAVLPRSFHPNGTSSASTFCTTPRATGNGAAGCTGPRELVKKNWRFSFAMSAWFRLRRGRRKPPSISTGLNIPAATRL